LQTALSALLSRVSAHPSLFGNKIIIKSIDEKDYKLLRYYVEALSERECKIFCVNRKKEVPSVE
jgi:hypothetical protein